MYDTEGHHLRYLKNPHNLRTDTKQIIQEDIAGCINSLEFLRLGAAKPPTRVKIQCVWNEVVVLERPHDAFQCDRRPLAHRCFGLTATPACYTCPGRCGRWRRRPGRRDVAGVVQYSDGRAVTTAASSPA